MLRCSVDLHIDRHHITTTNTGLQLFSIPYLVVEGVLHPPFCAVQHCHHSDGIVCVTLEASESGLSCCWVTELQGGLTTSLRMVGHSGGVEAVGSWA